MAYRYTLKAPNLKIGYTPYRFPNITLYQAWNIYIVDTNEGHNYYGHQILTPTYYITITETNISPRLQIRNNNNNNDHKEDDKVILLTIQELET